MKDPKALFPYVFVSSWIGDLVLTFLAFFLAFTHEGPLTPLVFLTVGGCILSGNLLPIAAYLLFTRWHALELRAEEASASLRVRDALRRSEDVIGRLEEADGSLSKAILIARQVPERIAEKFQALEALADRLDTLQVEDFTEALQFQGNALESHGERLASMRKTLEALADKVESLAGSLETARPADPETVSLEERLDLLFESIEALQEAVDGFSLPEEDHRQGPGEAIEEPESPPVEAVPEPEKELPPTESLPQEELVLEHAIDVPGREASTDGKTRLYAHAMIGMRNRLYIRGDGPALSWEKGLPMELTGIGEFAWSVDDLEEPIEVTVLLNDRLQAEEGPVRLNPGDALRILPSFPQEPK